MIARMQGAPWTPGPHKMHHKIPTIMFEQDDPEEEPEEITVVIHDEEILWG